MNQKEIVEYVNDLLVIENIKDFGPNGLQVEGDNREVKQICFAVSMTEEVIQKSIEKKADLIITHHGLFWDKDPRVVKGPMKRKLKLLLESGIASAAYHLPLDFHSGLGNNYQLAKKLKLKNLENFAETPKYAEGILGELDAISIEKLSQKVEELLDRKPVVLPFGPEKINKIAIITGGAQSYFIKAIEAGADCYITGEISEWVYTLSQEYGVHYISAGHYATEKFGLQALAKHMSSQLSIQHDFINIENPI
ncbi:MAG: Nif3-like dinuclear metal center hexameric protein [Deltaproteobacteria bacterium]|jgi:dinuclear metal center YbgI/SA1388 family protein|nr:Nif3-like dinuclear metal center hexameric protein [Deltaproteobacteria bacterium]MBT4525712.1 Nif3-like dinuclear metal center hexameric protein [Deltaproteobacteria bacterium]